MATPAIKPRAAAALLLLGVALPVISADHRSSPVAVATVQETQVAQSVQLFGTVTSEHASRLSVSTSGLITALMVDAGDEVQQGDLLLELDAELKKAVEALSDDDIERLAAYFNSPN